MISRLLGSARALPLFLVLASPSVGQVASGANYKNVATCREVVVSGKIYSTFGPGPCPPSTRRSLNNLALQRMQGAVGALANAQQSVLAIADALAARKRQESDAITKSIFFIVQENPTVSDENLYSKTVLVSPQVGETAVAQRGEVLIQRMLGFYATCIIPRVSHESKQMGARFKIEENEMACKLRGSDKAFTPTYFNAAQGNQPFSIIHPLVLRLEKDGKVGVCLRAMGTSFACEKGLTSDQITMTIGFVGNFANVSDAVRYLGIDGDTAVLQYASAPGELNVALKAPQIRIPLVKGSQVTIGPYSLELIDWSPTAIVTKVADAH